MKNNCLNCNEPLSGKFCSFCGQISSVKRIELIQLIKDLPHAIFHVDSGIFYNFKQLVLRPSMAIYDYLIGKRKPFFHPVTYLALALIFNYLAVKITGLHYYDQEELKTMSEKQASVILAYDESQWWFLEHTYQYMLLAISLSTLFLFIFLKFMKHNFNLSETIIIVLFTIAQGVIFQSLIYFSFGWIKSEVLIRGIETVNIVILFLYASYVIYGLFKINQQRFSKLTLGILSLVAGGGLLAIMVWSAYLLYDFSH